MPAWPCVPVKHRLSVLRRLGAGPAPDAPLRREAGPARQADGIRTIFRYRAFTDKHQRGVVALRHD
jgi:hypothetical protein